MPNGIEWGCKVELYLKSDPDTLLTTFEDYPHQYNTEMEYTFSSLNPGRD